MSRAGFERLLAATGALVRALPQLRDFAPWPADPPFADRPPQAIPAIAPIETLDAATTARTAPLAAAVAAVARDAHWEQTYSEAEVGRDFLDRYGWFELLGPGGHFRTGALRAYIAFWGAHLHYPPHLHEAEELYCVLAGEAVFHAAGMPSARLGPEALRLHRASQPHAMDTGAAPILTLVLWRGAGLEGIPRMAPP